MPKNLRLDVYDAVDAEIDRVGLKALNARLIIQRYEHGADLITLNRWIKEAIERRSGVHVQEKGARLSAGIPDSAKDSSSFRQGNAGHVRPKLCSIENYFDHKGSTSVIDTLFESLRVSTSCLQDALGSDSRLRDPKQIFAAQQQIRQTAATITSVYDAVLSVSTNAKVMRILMSSVAEVDPEVRLRIGELIKYTVENHRLDAAVDKFYAGS